MSFVGAYGAVPCNCYGNRGTPLGVCQVSNRRCPDSSRCDRRNPDPVHLPTPVPVPLPPDLVRQKELTRALQGIVVSLVAQKITINTADPVILAYIPWVPRIQGAHLILAMDAQVFQVGFLIEVRNLSDLSTLGQRIITTTEFASIAFTMPNVPSRVAVQVTRLPSDPVAISAFPEIFGISYQISG